MIVRGNVCIKHRKKINIEKNKTMSLKVEQILSNVQFVEKQPRIYSDGVFLVPMKIQIDGKSKFIWVADEFNDDTFDVNGNNISPRVIADSIDDLYV